MNHNQTFEDARSLVHRYVQDRGLRRHMQAVSAGMGFYAGQLGADYEYWRTVGLLHDFDWEIHPDLDHHPIKGADILRNEGWDEETVRVILSHYTEGTGVAREKPVDYALLACDEITGLIIAATLVRPGMNINELTLKSIRKKWKDRRFAAGVDREHVTEVTSDFSRECFDGQLDLWTHIQNILTAMQSAAADLELDGRLAG
ncbi:MAG: HDIG domain-containing protein [Chloroflexota bacterium]